MSLNVNYSSSEMMKMLDGKLPENTVQRKVDENLYAPKLSDSKSSDGIYTSVLRFVPNVADPNGAYVKKKVTWLKRNPQERNARPVDNPWSVNEFDNPINDLFFAMTRSGNNDYANIAKACMSTKDMAYATVQIIQDDNHPELVGRLMVLAFSKQIMDKITEEEKTSVDHVGINPFNAFSGRLFKFQITQGPKYPTYEKSKFFSREDIPSGIRYLDSNGQWQITNPNNITEQVGADLVKYLSENAPDLSTYAYTPWDDDTRKYVTETLTAIQLYATTGGVPQPTRAEVAFAQPAGDQGFTGVSQAVTSNVTQQFTQPAQPAAGVFSGVAPQASKPVAFPGVAQPVPANAQPVQAAPQYAQQTAPQAPQFGGNGFGIPQQQQAAPQVSGVTLPNVQQQAAPQVGADGDSPFGNIDDVLSAM